MNLIFDRIKEPSSAAGIGLILNGLEAAVRKDYGTAIINVVTGLVAIFVPERAR